MPSYTVEVVLLDEVPAGDAFVTDICAMLSAIAERDRLPLGPFELFPIGASTRGSRASSVVDPSATFVRECGVHRAQCVPVDRPNGRIQTVRVSVDCRVEPGAARPRAAIVKTYSYPLRTVFRHETGERFDLDVVLSGKAG